MSASSSRPLARILRAALAAVVLAVACARVQGPKLESSLHFAVSFPKELSAAPLDGRLLLLVSTDSTSEPRAQINDGVRTQQVFGIDVEGLQPGQEATFDAAVAGYPLDSLADIKPGTYQVQALLHRYETFHRADGHTIKLPMDRGEGQQWARAPGNLYSTPKPIAIDPRKEATIAIALDKTIPPIPDPADTKFIKHVKIQSDLLTKFWGRPMYLGANVLLPSGFDEHPNARYPLVIYHGHFPYTFANFREDPPDPNLKPDFSERFNWPGYNRTQQEYAYKFYKEWTGPRTPACWSSRSSTPTRTTTIPMRSTRPTWGPTATPSTRN